MGGSPLPRYAPPIQNQSRLFSGLGVGEEELLAFKLEAGDGLLGIGAEPPVDELLGGFLLDLAGLPIRTLYWLRRALSPWTRMFRGASPLAAALYLM